MYKTSNKLHNVHILLDCVDFLITELLKCREISITEAERFVKKVYEQKDSDVTDIMYNTMWNLIEFYSQSYKYLVFHKKFIKPKSETLYVVNLDTDLKTVIFKDVSGKVIKVIEDKEVIREIFKRNFEEEDTEIAINLFSFFENDEFDRVIEIRNYLLSYYELDIEPVKGVSIDFKTADIYKDDENEYAIYKKQLKETKAISS